MATNGEMFQFLSNFGPMLGQLAAHVDFLERRIEMLEGESAAPATPGAPGAPAQPDGGGQVEFMGQTFDMKAMFEAGMPAGGMAGMMERMKNYKAPVAASSPPAAAPAPAPTTTT